MEALKESNLRSFSFSNLARSLIIFENQTPAAIVIYREIEPEKLAEIDFVATAVEYKRKGLASALILDLSAKYGELWLELGAENKKALSLYGKLGFTAHGLRPDYYGKGEHAVNMVKTRAT